MKLATINKFLRLVGLVLVIAVDDRGKKPTRLWIEPFARFQKRAKAEKRG